MKIDPTIKQELKKFLEQKIKEEKKQVTILSSNQLSDKELNTLKNNFPIIKDSNPKIIIDNSLIAGVIIKVGTKIIDLSLKNQLKNLQNISYDTNR